MSSPKVLVGVTVPREEARRANRAQAAVYLDLARTLYMRQRDRSAALRRDGIALPDAVQTPDAAAQIVEAEMIADRSWQGLQIAHAYWQSLKHDLGDALDELEAQVLIASKVDAVVESAQDLERRKIVSRSMAVSFASVASEQLAPPDALAGIDRVAQRVAAVLAAAKAVGEDATTAIERTARTARSVDERCVALDVLRSRYGERATQARRAAAMERIAAERLERDRDDARTWIVALRAELAEAAERDIVALNPALDVFEASLPEYDSTSLEVELQRLRDAISRARARKSTLDIVMTTLRRQGYEEVVSEMQTITPQQIRRYYRDPVHDEHLVAIDASEEGSAVAIEAVRVVSGSDANARRADRETQQRLCNALATLSVTDSAAWRIDTVADVAPGAAMREQLDLASILDAPTGAKRARSLEARK